MEISGGFRNFLRYFGPTCIDGFYSYGEKRTGEAGSGRVIKRDNIKTMGKTYALFRLRINKFILVGR